MSKSSKLLLGLLLITWVAAMFFWALYRKERDAKVAAQEMAVTSTAQIEGMQTELAAIREMVSQLYEAKLNVPSTDSQLSGSVSELKQQLTQLLQSNNSHPADRSAASNPALPEAESLVRQQGISQLVTSLTTQEARVAAARVKLDEQITALNITDDIALVETAVALKLPSFRSFWPYFEARKQLEEDLNIAELLKRKLRIEEFEAAR
jgi:hypothetical protein